MPCYASGVRRRPWVTWRFIELRSGWRRRYMYGYTEPESYYAVYQSWRLCVFGIPLWRKLFVVLEVPNWQFFARACVGDPVLTREDLEKCRPCARGRSVVPTQQPVEVQ